MTKKTISLDMATIDVQKLTGFLQRGISVLAEQDSYKEDFKALMEEATEALKVDKKLLTAFIKARYKANTKDIVAQAEALDALSKAVDE
jgi:hypothetical protein